jgi:ribosomal protein S18 acetylase RimI-like enzyme
MHYREATQDDLFPLLDLYKAVARAGGGIARIEGEINEDYIQNFLSKSIHSGLIIVGENPEDSTQLICELHGYKPGIAVFDHVISDVTVVVHPEYQGKKLGRTIITIFLNEIYKNRPDVGKVELIARESNKRAIALYQSLGFLIEGRLEMRIKNAIGNYEADIPMGWQNPNYEF